ncbi:cobalamin-binding protein [Candidatus Nanosalina sp. VS9-1]|uniref:cobalamin-binding protein n=1 Tax=Candidatus Nanosalina sp. VS9-1 TaxID=3388566 RepID=UPI0039E19EEB
MKVISLAPSNTEILYAIGAEDDIVATTSLCSYPEEALEKPSIGGWTNPKIERIIEFDPDMILASDDLQDEAVEKIQEKGFPVHQVKPHSIEEVFESIIEIGEVVDRKEEAEKLVEEMKNDLEGLKFEGSPRIYCEEWMDPPMASGNWIPGLIEKAGGEPFLEDGERSREFEIDELKKFDPEYIFMNICGAGDALSTQELEKRSDWQSISAVDNEEVYVVDDSLLNRPSPRLIEGLEKMIEKVNSG